MYNFNLSRLSFICMYVYLELFNQTETRAQVDKVIYRSIVVFQG